MKLKAPFFSFLFLSIVQLPAQEAEEFSTAIEDNSMFIEEAYNQEEHVVQHISNFSFEPGDTADLFYTFTQEWPAGGLKHQLSYTFVYSSLAGGYANGIGDCMINYRYQLSYKQHYITSSPRISLLLPTGEKQSGLGTGSWGMQFNLPLSKRWSEHFITHANIGSTYFFSVDQSALKFRGPLVNYNTGLSAIWLMQEKFNLMLEYATNFTAVPVSEKNITYSAQHILAPAFRFAIDAKGLQIVPGFSLPFYFEENGAHSTGGFAYLSFEHSY